MKKSLVQFFLLSTVICHLSTITSAQSDRWQQKIKYQINVNIDVNTNRFTGTEKIDYWNNSPDTLTRVFFHLYWNAFQPNSSMDVRSRELGKTVLREPSRASDGLDWDARVKDRISKLTPEQIGFQRVASVKVNGVTQALKEHETILEVVLVKPIMPKSKIQMDVQFEAQVPLQIRRSGRDNAEGVRYSMSQWYPKLVEYDYQGWNANPYIAREFYGVWGDFDVNITIDKNYFVTAGGDLINANEIGRGYETAGTKTVTPAGNTVTWKWQAYNVHDFMWAADPKYKMITKAAPNGPLLRVVYKGTDSATAINDARWQRVLDTAVIAYPIIAQTFGPYPYKTYTFVQGGDGGMEYPMATLMKNASIGTAIHEWMHSWYQMMMGTNEALYPWMDEGFTDYATSRVMAEIKGNKGFAAEGSYRSYFNLAKSGFEEPASTHADHYNTNFAYGAASYSKGAVFMEQLGYIVGAKVRDQILLDYYYQWRFKHPNPNDFIRVAEKRSGMELDWYKEYFINSTKTIDYAVGDINVVEGKATLTMRRIGKMPMPLDVLVTYKDGKQEMHNIPLDLMYGTKPAEDATERIVEKPWRWTHPEYKFTISRGIQEIKSIEIDPSMRLADINRNNNKLVIPD
ncbi:MAG: M1 family metallopeptidase [Chitinophagaceae bacterium]|nr:M1 family metallopeptidase [Chitinophagaceae bacterium]